MTGAVGTFISFDLGMKHIGVAVGQSVTGTASALSTLKAQNGVPRWEDITALIKAWQPEALIVGLPLHLDGKTQWMTEAAQRFANQLNGRYHLPVHMTDERLTSQIARQQLSEMENSKARRQIDSHSVAAKLILEQWLAEGGASSK